MSLSIKILIAVAALLISPTINGATSSFISTFPIPAAESIEFATNWLRDEGFRVLPIFSPAGNVSLTATRGEETIRVGISPQSPLGSLVEFSSTTAADKEHSAITALKASLEGYVLTTLEEGIDSSPDSIPEVIKTMGNSVRCLKASVKGEAVNFSGFVADRQLLS